MSREICPLTWKNDANEEVNWPSWSFFFVFFFLHLNENFDMWNSHFHMWITYTHTYLAFFHMWVRIYIYGNKTRHMKSHTVCTCEYHIFLKFDVPFAIFTCELTYANWAFSQSTILKGLQSEFHTWKISFKSVKKNSRSFAHGGHSYGNALLDKCDQDVCWCLRINILCIKQ